MLDVTKLKPSADDKSNVAKNGNICLCQSRKHCGKRRKCWLPVFSPFPTVFSKAAFFTVVKSQDCALKRYGLYSFNLPYPLPFPYLPRIKACIVSISC